MNSVQVLGNLTRDPQIRATKTGRAVASFSIAVNRAYTTPQGEKKELTEFINVVAWGDLAEAVGNKLKREHAYLWKDVIQPEAMKHRMDPDDM